MKSLNDLIAISFAILLFQIFVVAQSGAAATVSSPNASPTPFALPSNDKNASPGEKKTEIQFNYTYESLTRNLGEWHTASIDFIHYFSKRQVVYGTLLATKRFGQRDRQFTVGIYQPLNRKWTVQLEGGVSPTHRVLPKWSALGQIERSFKKGWNTQVGYRRMHFTSARVNLGIVGVEKYWGNYRAAYTLYVSQLANTGASASNRFQFNRYYGENVSSVGLSAGFGREIESLGNRRVLQTDVQSVALSGRHWVSRHWGINYDASLVRQGNLYTRRGLTFGVRYKF